MENNKWGEGGGRKRRGGRKTLLVFKLSPLVLNLHFWLLFISLTPTSKGYGHVGLCQMFMSTAVSLENFSSSNPLVQEL